MGNVLVDESVLQNTADFIRSRLGITDKFKPGDFNERLNEVSKYNDSILDGTVTDYYNDKITILDTMAFNYRSSLTSVNMQNLRTIINNNSNFQGCESLTSVDMPMLMNIYSGYTFYNCTSLKSVNMKNLRIINNTFGYFFGNCTSLSHISLPSLTYTDDNTFYFDTSLSSIDLPVLSSAGNSTFYNCTSLTSVTLPSLIEVKGSTFNNCEFLTNVALPVLTNINGGYTFNNCKSLTSVSIPLLTSISSATNMFGKCSLLTDVLLGSSSISTNISFSDSPSLSDASITNIINALADLTGSTSRKLTLNSTTYAKLTSEQIASITSKNWTVA